MTTVIPTYRIEMDVPGFRYSPIAWKGRATQKRLDDWVATHIESLKTGGANEHLSEDAGYMPIPQTVRLIHQDSNQEICRWEHPPFLMI